MPIEDSDDRRARDWKVKMTLAGIKQNALARDMGIDATRLSKILNGWITPRSEEANFIDDYLDARVKEEKEEYGEPALWERVTEHIIESGKCEFKRMLELTDVARIKEARDLSDLGKALAVTFYRDAVRKELMEELREVLDERMSELREPEGDEDVGGSGGL